MLCPECKTEYEDWVKECADCHVPLEKRLSNESDKLDEDKYACEWDEEIKEEINRLRSVNINSYTNIILLLISISLFIYLGLFSLSIKDITIIITVLFIHEFGHLLGMRIFRYKNLQMLFIPFFGAMASGEETSPNSTKEAIINLMGPILGIISGIIALIVGLYTNIQILHNYAALCFIINGFNLLPIYPLDGGRFFDEILFKKNIFIELIFKVAACIVLGYIAVSLHSWVIGIVGIAIFMNLKTTYITSKIAKRIKKSPDSIQDLRNNDISESFIAKARVILGSYLKPNQKSPKILARFIHNIWTRLSAKPISIIGTAGFILVYILITSIVLTSTILLAPSIISERIQWEEFTSIPGKFSILMPQVPTEKVIPANAYQINSLMYHFACEYRPFIFTVSYMDIPEEFIDKALPQVTLYTTHRSFAVFFKGKIIEERQLLFKNYPGRESKIQLPANDVLLVRSYIVNKREYHISIVGKKYYLKLPAIKYYLDSFKLIN